MEPLNSGFFEAIAFGRSGMAWTEDVMLGVGTKAVGDKLSSLNESVLHSSWLLLIAPNNGLNPLQRVRYRDSVISRQGNKPAAGVVLAGRTCIQR